MDRRGNQTTLKRIALWNGIPIATFAAVVNYAGDVLKEQGKQTATMATISATVNQLQEKTGAIGTDVAVIKSRLERIEGEPSRRQDRR